MGQDDEEKPLITWPPGVVAFGSVSTEYGIFKMRSPMDIAEHMNALWQLLSINHDKPSLVYIGPGSPSAKTLRKFMPRGERDAFARGAPRKSKGWRRHVRQVKAQER